MMANSARDPYWQAACGARSIDHPERDSAIQVECAACHMPMAARTGCRSLACSRCLAASTAAGRTDPRGAVPRDGVSCTVSPTSIQPDGLGTEATINGRFHVAEGERAADPFGWT